jgi:hypothetical protein
MARQCHLHLPLLLFDSFDALFEDALVETVTWSVAKKPLTIQVALFEDDKENDTRELKILW